MQRSELYQFCRSPEAKKRPIWKPWEATRPSANNVRTHEEKGVKIKPEKIFEKKLKLGVDILSLVCYIEATQEPQGVGNHYERK